MQNLIWHGIAIAVLLTLFLILLKYWKQSKKKDREINATEEYLTLAADIMKEKDPARYFDLCIRVWCWQQRYRGKYSHYNQQATKLTTQIQNKLQNKMPGIRKPPAMTKVFNH